MIPNLKTSMLFYAQAAPLLEHSCVHPPKSPCPSGPTGSLPMTQPHVTCLPYNFNYALNYAPRSHFAPLPNTDNTYPGTCGVALNELSRRKSTGAQN